MPSIPDRLGVCARRCVHTSDMPGRMPACEPLRSYADCRRGRARCSANLSHGCVLKRVCLCVCGPEPSCSAYSYERIGLPPSAQVHAKAEAELKAKEEAEAAAAKAAADAAAASEVMRRPHLATKSSARIHSPVISAALGTHARQPLLAAGGGCGCQLQGQGSTSARKGRCRERGGSVGGPCGGDGGSACGSAEAGGGGGGGRTD